MLERWQMNKLGFVNFWLYDWEEFTFSEGRLLLRGENGAGKSITTQSFIPFMLDGDMRPHRLDSFGSKDRKMEYYLLGGGAEESTGYLYLEFTKPQHKLYRTFVIGLRARKGKPIDFWGFCLSDGRRVGCGEGEFPLFSTRGSQRIALTRQEARSQFGDGENWVERSGEYKQMVNRMLFGCREPDQYDRLLKLLMDIRKPKLSKDFSPELVRGLLNESLQPLGEDDIAPMVQSMEKMDDIQNRLENLRDCLRAARTLRNEYKRYNEFVLGKKGEFYLTARAGAQELVQEAEDLRQQTALTEDSLSAQRAARGEAERRIAELQREYDALSENEQLEQSVQKLAAQRGELAQAQAAVEALKAKEADTQRSVDAKTREEQTAQRLFGEQREALRREFAELDALNDTVRYPHHPASPDALRHDAQRGALDEYGARLRRALSLLQQREAARDELDARERRRDEAQSALRREQAQLEQAEAMLARERDALCEAFAALEDERLAFRLTADDVRRLTALAGEYEGMMQEQAIASLLSDRRQALAAPLLERRAALQQRRNALQNEFNELRRQKRELEAQSELPPPRRPAVEATRALLRERGVPHAAFYELVDFDPALSPQQRALLEAQLLDAGVLDALVVPETARGALDDVLQTHPDCILCLDGEAECASSLPLRAETGAPAWADVASLVRRLSAQPGGAAHFGPDGRYRQGVLRGKSVPDESARYIGATARQENRARQIAALDAQLADKEAEMREAEQERQTAQEALARLDEEYRQRPTTADVAAALQIADAQRAKTARCGQELDEREQRVREQQKLVSELHAKFLSLARELPYEQTADAYQEAVEDFEAYRDRFYALIMGSAALEQKREGLDNLRLTLDVLNDALLECVDRIRDGQARCRQIQRAVDALQEYLDRPETQQLARRLGQLRAELEAARKDFHDAGNAVTRHETDLSHLRPRLEERNGQAQRAVAREEHLRAVFEEELLHGPGQPGRDGTPLWQQAEQAKTASASSTAT